MNDLKPRYTRQFSQDFGNKMALKAATKLNEAASYLENGDIEKASLALMSVHSATQLFLTATPESIALSNDTFEKLFFLQKQNEA